MSDVPVAAGSERCDNCDVALVGPFCHLCGQRDVDHLTSVRVFVAHLLELVVGYDSRLLRSVRTLFAHPGLLTAEYAAGRRVRYLAPLQLYLIAATMLFVAASFNPMVRFSPSTRQFRSSLPTFNTSSRLTAAEVARLKQEGLSLEVFGERFANTTTARLSTFLVLTVPLLTLVLAIVFAGTGRRFGVHAVFAMHWSAFYLGTLAVLQLFNRTSYRSPVAAILIISLPFLYLIAAISRAYGTGRPSALLRAAIVYVCYLLTLGSWLTLVTRYTVNHM